MTTVKDAKLADGTLWGREVTNADGTPLAHFAYLDGVTWERTTYSDDGIPVIDVVASVDDYPDPLAPAFAAVEAATTIPDLAAATAAYLSLLTP